MTGRDQTSEVYTALTNGVRVSVTPSFRQERSDPPRGRYVWSYAVTIANLGDSAVQLLSRRWVITDARNIVEEVKGPGVVGAQPTLQPGENFSYESLCPLTTDSGSMQGVYVMLAADGTLFEAEIPTFSLHLPTARRKLN